MMRNIQDQAEAQACPREPRRFGPYAVVREIPTAEDGDVLGLFPSEFAASGAAPTASSPTLPAGAERRRSPRFIARESRLWVGWWAGPNRFHTVASLLDNISQGGARVVTPDPPPAGQLVWLCLGIPRPTECVGAKVLEVTPIGAGDHAIRLAFGAPCPANFYRIAVLGSGPRAGFPERRTTC